MTKRTLPALWKVMALIAGIFLIGNCYYDVEEELYPNPDCQTADVSYSQDVLPIIQNNCYSCHNAVSRNGNVVLEGYSNLKSYANSGALLGVIKHQDGYPAMPQNQPQLVECQIAKIEQWITDGAPDN